MNAEIIGLLPYTIIVLISASIAGYMWYYRHVEGAKALLAFTLAQVMITVAYMLELGTLTLEAKHFWDDAQWVGQFIAVLAVFVLALRFAQLRIKRLPHLVMGLSVPFLAFLGVLVLNTPLVREVGQIVPSPTFGSLVYDYYWPFLAISGYIYLIAIITLFIIGRAWAQRQGIYKTQAVIMFLGVLTPAVGSLYLFVAEPMNLPIFQRDLSPFYFTASNIVLAWGLLRYRLFDLTPIAHETVIQGMQDALIVLDARQRVVNINPAARGLFSLAERDDVVGQPASTVFADWYACIATQNASYAAPTPIMILIEDQPRHFAVTNSPLQDSAGALSGRVIVMREITEIVRTRDALKESAEQLQQAYAELEQAHKEAQAGREAAEEANRVKSYFLASMSHELRTPLNAILNFSKMMSMQMFGPISEEQTDIMEKVVDSSMHLLSLINDILDISKLESGVMNLLWEEDVDLTADLDKVIAAGQSLIGEKAITLITDVDSPLPPVRVDRRRIRQILLNLLSNAIKFTPEGSITLAVKTRSSELLFAVMDNGVGIDPSEQTTIFEPFEQASDGLRRADGTGLGLPISKRLVEVHGGRMWLDSDLGEGSSFFFTIPLTSDQPLMPSYKVEERAL